MEPSDPVTGWQARISAFDKLLQPIAHRPVDIHRPNWVHELREKPEALDEAKIRSEVEAFLHEMVDRYPTLSETDRQRTRELFHAHPSFTWAAGFRFKVTDEESLRQHLVLFSIRDQHTDARDEIMVLDHLCGEAATAKLDAKPLLCEVAAISSSVNRFGLGSAQNLLLARAGVKVR